MAMKSTVGLVLAAAAAALFSVGCSSICGTCCDEATVKCAPACCKGASSCKGMDNSCKSKRNSCNKGECSN